MAADKDKVVKKSIVLKTGGVLIIEGIHFLIENLDPKAQRVTMRAMKQEEVDQAYEMDRKLREALAIAAAKCICEKSGSGVSKPNKNCPVHFPKKKTMMEPIKCETCHGVGHLQVAEGEHKGAITPCPACNKAPASAAISSNGVGIGGGMCQECAGTGNVKGMFGNKKKCPDCEGSGQARPKPARSVIPTDCQFCKGTGKAGAVGTTAAMECVPCRGTGKVVSL